MSWLWLILIVLAWGIGFVFGREMSDATYQRKILDLEKELTHTRSLVPLNLPPNINEEIKWRK